MSSLVNASEVAKTTVPFALIDGLLADGLQQVSFADADAAVQKQRIVGRSGLIDAGQRAGMRQPIARSHDEFRE